jgi:hypothetical protein
LVENEVTEGHMMNKDDALEMHVVQSLYDEMNATFVVEVLISKRVDI